MIFQFSILIFLTLLKQKNGELRKDAFGDLFNFSNCLANVLKLIEGAAYRPETQMNADFTEVLLDRQPIDDNGSGLGRNYYKICIANLFSYFSHYIQF